MAFRVEVELNLPDAQKVVEATGLGADGDVQNFHTLNVLRRMQKYMPMQTGAFIKNTIAHTNLRDAEIVSVGPQAAYLYRGKAMVDSVTGKGPAYIPGIGYRYRKGATLKETDRDLEYSHEKNPQAGPYWDRELVANEGDILVRELQNYIDRRGK